MLFFFFFLCKWTGRVIFIWRRSKGIMETAAVEPSCQYIDNYYFPGSATDSGDGYVERRVVKSKKIKCVWMRWFLLPIN